MPDIDYDALRTALIDATQQALGHMIDLTRDEHLYAFGLYVHDEMTYSVSTSNTEEGLLESAKRYAEKNGKPIEYYLKCLRWLPADWKYHCEGAQFFTEVENILADGWREDFSFFDPDPARISAICMDALRAGRAMLTREGQGQSILINLFYIDISDIKRLQLAEKLNPAHLYAQYKQDLEAGS